jgi:hypothetical protein
MNGKIVSSLLSTLISFAFVQGISINRKLLQESNPQDLLPDGTPAQWVTTRGTLKVLAVRADFPNNVHPPIPIEGNLNFSLLSTNLFFSDSSWGKLNLSYTFPPIVNVTTRAADSTASTIKTEALSALEQIGYVYCGGPCGTQKATKPGQYDAVILAFVGFPPTVDWAGLGVVGNLVTWTLYGTSGAVLEHEVGHNFGMGHGMTAKTRVDGIPYNTQQYEGFTRMAAGGEVIFGDEKSRYNRNGHFDPSCKHWFGWLEDADVVFMHPLGASASCPQCVATWSGKLNAFDRPDVVPGKTDASSGSPAFAIKVAYAPTNVVYIYYRSSYPATRRGISVQYCRRSYSSELNVGMSSVCYTYDAAGDTGAMDDSTILPGTTYVATPPPAAIEDVGLAAVAGILPVIQVTSVPDFADCPDMICPPNKDISASLSVSFLNDTQAAPPPVAFTVAPSPVAERQLVLPSGPVLFRVADPVQGARGRGIFNFSLCPAGGLEDATLYVYDAPPLSALLFNAQPGYQAVNRFQAFAVDCCAPGDTFAAAGVRAVVVRQMDPQPLAIAELQVFLAAAPTVNVAAQARCWSLPPGGAYYNGDGVTGRQSLMTDGDLTTYSHSGSDSTGGKGHVDMCVFDAPVDVRRLTVWPRQVRDRERQERDRAAPGRARCAAGKGRRMHFAVLCVERGLAAPREQARYMGKKERRSLHFRA